MLVGGIFLLLDLIYNVGVHPGACVHRVNLLPHGVMATHPCRDLVRRRRIQGETESMRVRMFSCFGSDQKSNWESYSASQSSELLTYPRGKVSAFLSSRGLGDREPEP